MEIEHRQLLTLLDDLMKPISTVKISSQDEEQQQQQLLTINLVFSNACDRFLEVSAPLGLIIPTNNDQPVYYRYLQIHLNLLEILLSYEQKNLSSPLPLFSVQDESILSRSLSFTILLGLILHFDEGISISIEKYLNNSTSSIHLLKLKTNLTHHNRMYYLNQTLELLMKWIKTNPNSYIIQRLCSYHLLELILSHFQLLYSPNLKYSSEQFSSINLHENLEYLKANYFNIFIQQIMLLNRLLSTTINSPIWLKNRCGEFLTSILIDKNNQGIRRIFQIILESTSPNDQWRVHSSMAQILSTCPKQITPEEYVQRIKFQIIELIHDKRYMPVICIALDQLCKKYPKLVEEEILTILFQPLISCRNRLSNKICTEEEFEFFLNDLYNLRTIFSNEFIRIYLSELINIYFALEKSLSSLKSRFSSILRAIFSSIDIELCIRYFEEILFRIEFIPLKFTPDESSMFSLVIDKDLDDDVILFSQLISKLFVSIENNDRLIAKIFLNLLQSLITNNDSNGSIIWTENDRQMNIKQLKIMEVLKCIMEYLTEHIDIFIKNVDDTIKVVQIILEKITKTYREKQNENLFTKTNDDDDDEDLSSDNEALQIVFTIASLLITHYDQLSYDNKQILASLYSSFTWIEQNHSNDQLRQLAHELSIAFVTFGAVKEISTKPKSNLLIEELNNERDLRSETFENALFCLSDESIPIRAHGLILFRRLIERSDEETLLKIQEDNMKLFRRFQEHLHVDDSYEYLAAINVLSALANRYTDQILPIICYEYVNRKLEDRLKVGEILVKTCRLLGDMSTKYSSLLINTFLNASKQKDDDMYRASALSNLGQLCTVMKYSLSKDLPEILMALKSYLSIFESSDVRRASILVCELLCQSLEQSTWLTILGNELTSFYQLINQIYKNDKDEVVRLHAQIALEALNKISRDYLQPSIILEKKIRILS